MVQAAQVVERAQRDAVKAAVPEAAPLLRTEQNALAVQEALDRMGLRQGNRDVIGLPAWMALSHAANTGQEVRSGVLAMVANWIRAHQMGMGLAYADAGKALQSGDARQIIRALQKIGVALPSQVVRPEGE
jgi:hypothetical protein